MEDNGLGVARSLAAVGVRCLGLGSPAWNHTYASKSCKIVRCPEWSCDGLIETLLGVGRKSKTRIPVLITKEEAVVWISEHRERLAEYFELNLPSRDTLTLLLNKTQFDSLAAAKGWPIPKSYSVKSHDDISSLLNEAIFPCILKPAIKNSAFRANAPSKAFMAESPQALLKIYEMVSAWEREAIVQEWIQGDDNRIGYCLTYFDRNGEPLAMFPGRKLRQRPPGCGNTAVASPAPEEWRDSMLRLTREIFASVGFQGLGSIEYKVRPDNSLVIMEPTAGRTNYQNEISVLNGVNIPAIAYFDLLGQEWHPAGRGSGKAYKLIDGRSDLWALRHSLRYGSPSFSRWLEDRSGAKRYMRWRVGDPGPTMAVFVFFLFRLLRYLLRLPLKLSRRLLNF